MNRGFITYYSEGLKAAAKTLYKNKNLPVYWVYLLMNLLARLTLFPAVLFDLVAVRQAKYAYEEGRLSLCASFRAAEKGKSLGPMLLVRFEQFLMIASAVAIAALVGGALGFCGALIAQEAEAEAIVMQLLFVIPLLVFGVLTACLMILFFAPSSYTVDKNYGFGMAGVLETSFDTMKERGKWTHFLHHFVALLVKGAVLGGIFGLCYAASENSGGVAIAFIVLAVLLSIVFLVFAPLFTLAPRVADYLLMEDISLDPSNRAKHAKTVCISRSTGSSRDYGHDKKLLELFDADGNDADYYAYDSAARRQSAKEASEAFDSFVATAQEQPVAPATPEAPVMPETPPDHVAESGVNADAESGAKKEPAPETSAEVKKKTTATAGTRAKKTATVSKSEPTTTDTGDDL